MAIDTSKLKAAADAAVALLQTLAANQGDPNAQAEVDAVTTELTNAVTANTPATPAAS